MVVVCANLRATRVESGRSPEWIAKSKPSSMIVVGLSDAAISTAIWGRQQKKQAALTPYGGGQTWEERSHESSLSVQFGLDRFVKSRFQSRRQCAKQTRKSRDLPRSAQWNERYGESVRYRTHLQGRRSVCWQPVDRFHVPWRQRRSSLFQLLGRTSAWHR